MVTPNGQLAVQTGICKLLKQANATYTWVCSVVQSFPKPMVGNLKTINLLQFLAFGLSHLMTALYSKCICTGLEFAVVGWVEWG
jgi:hypothetical protein